MCIQKIRSKISYFKCRTSELYLFINLYESHFAFCSLIFHLIKESRSKKKFLMPNKKLILHLNYYHSFKKFVFFFFFSDIKECYWGVRVRHAVQR